MSVCESVGVRARAWVNEREAACARVEGEEKRKWKILYEVIGKRKEKVIPHVAHLPVCLKAYLHA